MVFQNFNETVNAAILVWREKGSMGKKFFTIKGVSNGIEHNITVNDSGVFQVAHNSVSGIIKISIGGYSL